MVRLPNISLTDATKAELSTYQLEIDRLQSYPEQVTKAGNIWPSRKQNKPFEEVKARLVDMCSGAKRCCYCEDSMADEIEHIAPKNLFPGKTFVWENYLYSCGPCNGPKSNQWAIFRDADRKVLELAHPEVGPPEPLESGDPLLINPREEDPLDLICLSLGPSLLRLDFVPIPEDQESEAFKRAKYTIEILRLNIRSKLGEARREAYGNYRARMAEIAALQANDDEKSGLPERISELRQAAHPTVWREIQRYRRNGWLAKADPQLDAYFNAVPEAASW